MENTIVKHMNQDLKTCDFCHKKTVEELSPNHFTCSNCGFGYKEGTAGKPDIETHLEFLKKAVMTAKILRPDLNPEQLAEYVQRALHKVEKHPLNKDNYCEYCHVSYKQ